MSRNTPLPAVGRRATGLPVRDLCGQAERLAHLDAALRAGVLSADETAIMRDLIRDHPGALGELDIYRRFSSDPTTPGAWVVWTHAGERPVHWWKAVCQQAIWRDRGRR